jgi:tRNA(Ile)-lysidine synthase
MIERFLRHIRTKNLLDDNSRYLLGISGGIDSVCLGHLLYKAGIQFALAHVNFGLRKEESDEDEQFVYQLASDWGVQCHVYKAQYDEIHMDGLSVQMAARDLRYSWFNQICENDGFDGVIVAHHFEDQIETVLLNLLRVTGIEGLYGMAEKRGNVIRPLLPFRRSELEAYMQAGGHVWREDSSNKKTLYKRNYVRHAVIPVIQEGFPEGISALDQSFGRLKETGKAFFYLYQNWKESNIKTIADGQYLDIEELKHVPGRVMLLYYWLRDFGYTYAAVQDLAQAIDIGQVGKKFLGTGYVLNLDRTQLILAKISPRLTPFMISKHDIEVEFGLGTYELMKLDAPVTLDRNPENAMLDFEKLEFPLEVRSWQEGDRIVPLGMKSEKKISDLLVDMKIPLVQKDKIQVLCSKGQIVWLVGFRISDRYKCDDSSRHITYFKKKQL